MAVKLLKLSMETSESIFEVGTNEDVPPVAVLLPYFVDVPFFPLPFFPYLFYRVPFFPVDILPAISKRGLQCKVQEGKADRREDGRTICQAIQT